MIEGLSSWAKNLALAIIIVSILEMLLPNNKTKKYVKMIMGIYVLFNIISPLVSNKDISFNIEEYIEEQAVTTSVNQESMNKRLEELYKEELEKDIKEKVKNQGYDVNKCSVDVTIGDKKEDTKIEKIVLTVKKNESNKQEDINIENKMVTEIQKIKNIDTSISSTKGDNKETVTDSDIGNIKNFLIKEYEVDEKCLKIN